MNCHSLITRKVLTGPMASFVQDQKLQELGKCPGNPVASALVALFSTGCCLLTTVSGTVPVIKVNVLSLPLLAGKVVSFI